MDSPSKPSLSVSGSVGTLWNEYLTILSSLLEHTAGIFASIFLTSRNYKDGAQADMQYILTSEPQYWCYCQHDCQLWNNSLFTHKDLSVNASLNPTLFEP